MALSTRTLSCPIPNNINPLQNNGFLFSIQKLPEMQYFCQEVPLPGMNLPPATVNSPFSTVFIPGDKITFEPLTIIFMINETLSNYLAISAWITAMGFPEDRAQYKSFIDAQIDNTHMMSELSKGYSDGVLSILGNTGQPIRSIEFIDLYPTSINSLQMKSDNNDTTFLMGQATFLYNYYKILPVVQNVVV